MVLLKFYSNSSGNETFTVGLDSSECAGLNRARFFFHFWKWRLKKEGNSCGFYSDDGFSCDVFLAIFPSYLANDS